MFLLFYFIIIIIYFLDFLHFFNILYFFNILHFLNFLYILLFIFFLILFFCCALAVVALQGSISEKALFRKLAMGRCPRYIRVRPQRLIVPWR